MNAKPSRAEAYAFGLSAEGFAALYLRLKGFSIVERRVRGQRGGKRGEIDLVARRGRLLLFVEVKARQSLDEAALSITPRQRERIQAAAETYIAKLNYKNSRPFSGRYDAILVAPGRFGLPRMKHVPGAW